jgi:hypothetical protein
VQGHGSAARQSRGENNTKEEGVGHGREGARRKSGEGSAGGRACLAVPSLGDAVRAAARRRRGDAVTWLQKRKLEKNKTIEKTRKHTRIPAVPVLGVGVLTGWENGPWPLPGRVTGIWYPCQSLT